MQPIGLNGFHATDIDVFFYGLSPAQVRLSPFPLPRAGEVAEGTDEERTRESSTTCAQCSQCSRSLL